MSKMTKIGAALAVAALGTGSLLSDAGAVNLDTHGAAFQPYNAGQANDIDYVTQGVRTSASSDRYAIASVVRSPLTSGTAQGFWIDGTNGAGKTTYFTLYSYGYTGNLESSVSFNSNLSDYDIYQTLDPVNTYSYVSLLALLPASYGGTVRGVISIQ